MFILCSIFLFFLALLSYCRLSYMSDFVNRQVYARFEKDVTHAMMQSWLDGMTWPSTEYVPGARK